MDNPYNTITVRILRPDGILARMADVSHAMRSRVKKDLERSCLRKSRFTDWTKLQPGDSVYYWTDSWSDGDPWEPILDDWDVEKIHGRVKQDALSDKFKTGLDRLIDQGIKNGAVRTLPENRVLIRIVGPYDFSPEVEREVSERTRCNFILAMQENGVYWGIKTKEVGGVSYTVTIPLEGAFETRELIKDLLNKACAEREEFKLGDIRTVTICHPEHDTIRTIFRLSEDHYTVIRTYPGIKGVQDDNGLVRITAKNDQEYHNMVSWIRDYRERSPERGA